MDRSVPAKTDKVKKDKKTKKVKKAKKAKRSRRGDAAASAAAADASAATVAGEQPSPKKRRRTGRDTSSAGASTNASTAAAATKKPNKPVTKKKKAKPPVEVVEFVAPGARRAAAREKIREEIRRRGGDADEANAGAGGGVDLSSRRAFYSVYREVQDFGVTGLGVRSQKVYEAKRVAELGGDSSHHIKMPIKMLLGVRKARVKREEKQREMERLSGVITGKKYANKSSKYHDRRRKQFNSRKGTAGVNNLGALPMKNGVLFVTNAM